MLPQEQANNGRPKSKGAMPTNSDTAIKVATSAGTVVGQVRCMLPFEA
jgi:hypothetical protein